MVHGYHLIIDKSADRQWNHQHRLFPTELKTPYDLPRIRAPRFETGRSRTNKILKISDKFGSISRPFHEVHMICKQLIAKWRPVHTWMWLLFTFFGMFKCTGLVKKKWIGIKRSWIRWIYQNLTPLHSLHTQLHNRHRKWYRHHYLVADFRCRNNLYGKYMDIHWNILCDRDMCQNIEKRHGNRF